MSANLFTRIFYVEHDWEITDAVANFAKGKVESGEFYDGGLKWAVAMSRRTNFPEDTVDFTLRCDLDHSGPWKCKMRTVEVVQRDLGDDIDWTFTKGNVRFDEKTGALQYKSDVSWETVADSSLHNNGKVTIQVSISNIRLERGAPYDLAMFDAPNNRSDVVLVIGEKKLHVSKELLSIHSPVFEVMFFGNFEEKGKDEVKIKDVVYEEFCDLLRIIYPGPMGITNRTVVHILKLADRFQMKGVMNHSEKFLIYSTGIENKLLLADQYRLTSLMDHYLNKFTVAADLLENLQSSPESDNFSDAMKIAIYDRIKKLKPKMADDSKIVFRWEVPDAATKFATGKVESGEFYGEIFKWAFAMSRRTNHPEDTADFSLQCDANHNGLWKCKVDVDVFEIDCARDKTWLLHSNKSIRYCICENSETLLYNSVEHWDNVANPRYHVNDKATFEVHIRIIESEIISNLAMFDSPNNRSDVVLVIGEKKLHVSKELLSIHSPVFEALFFGNNAEKGKYEVKIKDVVYEEFCDLLRMIYPDPAGIADCTVLHILKLADRFKMKGAMYQAEQFLIRSWGIKNNLFLADQYRLTSLRDHYLDTCTASDLKNLQNSPESANFSVETKAAVFDRILKLRCL